MVEKFIRRRLQMRQVLRRRRFGPEPVTDKNITAGASPPCEPAADSGKATRDAAAAEHHREVERCRFGAVLCYVELEQPQARERAAPLCALPRRVEHRRRNIDGGNVRLEALDDAQCQLAAAAAQVEYLPARLQRQQIEGALDLRRRNRVAIVVVAVRDGAEFVLIQPTTS